MFSVKIYVTNMRTQQLLGCHEVEDIASKETALKVANRKINEVRHMYDQPTLFDTILFEDGKVVDEE